MPVPSPPRSVHDRLQEWSALWSFATQKGSGARVALVYGRRRQGKTFLLRHLVDRLGGIYHVAFEEERRPALDRLGGLIARESAVASGLIRFSDWAEAVQAILRVTARDPRLVVIDEFPYLLAHSPELPSILQAAIDESRQRRGPPARLVLCGSAVATMSRLLGAAAPLRGRARVELVVHPFDYREAASFCGLQARPSLALLVHAILGGTPGYLDLAGRMPRSLHDVPRWLSESVLSTSSPIFRELPHLVRDEPGLADTGLYASVLDAIAAGLTRPTQIASALERPVSALRHALTTLESTRLVARMDDVFRRQRPAYEIAEPTVRFHHAVVRPMWTRFERGDTARAWRASDARFRERVLAPHFEHLAREWTSRFASEDTLDGVASTVGPAVINDAAGRSQLQLDVAALAPGRRKHRVLAIGEAKSSDKPVGPSELSRLERARALLQRRTDVEASTTRLALFSRSGFTPALSAIASQRPDVILVNLERLYAGH